MLGVGESVEQQQPETRILRPLPYLLLNCHLVNIQTLSSGYHCLTYVRTASDFPIIAATESDLLTTKLASNSY